MADPAIENGMAFAKNRVRGVHFCESCRQLKRADKRSVVKKGWVCSDCRLVKK